MTKKTFAKIVFFIMLAVTIAVGVWAHFYEAPYRLIENYVDAVERNDEKAFNKYADGAITLGEEYGYFLYASGFTEEEDPKFKAKLLKREQRGSSVWLTVRITAYNDSRHTEFEMPFIVKPHRFGVLQVGGPG
ncbi:MAG: hypothetical protein LBL87_04255 [Ruminococcus sp.]|jgi:hypothetical protein|nr:hypothetical protein [Ruminococcus sp.]